MGETEKTALWILFIFAFVYVPRKLNCDKRKSQGKKGTTAIIITTTQRISFSLDMGRFFNRLAWLVMPINIYDGALAALCQSNPIGLYMIHFYDWWREKKAKWNVIIRIT